MKNVLKALALLAMTAASLPALAATEVSAKPVDQQNIGVISVSAAGGSLSDLLTRLDAKASAEGAGSYRVISAGGRNNFYGSAELYK